MLASVPVYFSSPRSLVVAVFLSIILAVIHAVRRPAIGRWPTVLFFFGSLLIAAAAGQPIINRRVAVSVAVMVDLSPSTRGATFRDRAALDARLRGLLGDQPYRLVTFADSIQPLPAGAQLPDMPVDRTVFTPPVADAILLFSDGRFDLPATGPPTYSVIDPAMNTPGDAAVTAIESSGKSVMASVRNEAGPRPLHWTGATPFTPAALIGSYQQYAKPDRSGGVTAALSGSDRWPENDSLSIQPTPKNSTERWWIGPNAPAGWRQFAPSELPGNAVDYLNASAIVLQNIPADSFSTVQHHWLNQYIRDLGGSLTIVGGDHAFAAGNYDGTPLDLLSPLASSPPQATTQWMLLVDGSGSMAGDGGTGPTPWRIESSAIAALLPRLPPNDPVNVGSFAASLSWWTSGKPAKETALLHFPPPSAFPSGPTNLAAVLQQIIKSVDGSSLVQLLVMTDADTDLPDPDLLAAQMKQRKIHLHILATGHGSALPALREIAAATDGSVVEQLDPREWIAAAQILLKRALPTRYEHSPLTAAAQTIPEWNQTWLRSDSNAILRAADTPLIATWQHGLGKVTAIAYPADATTITAVSTQIETPPRDPRFAVTWENGSSLKIEVDAIDGNAFLNGQSIQSELRSADDVSQTPETNTIPQTGPGRYGLTIPTSRRARIVSVFNGTQVLARFAVSGRYAPEFDHIGNDLPALQELARRTGGRVIRSTQIGPIDFHWPLRATPLAPVLALMAFATFALALLLDRHLSR